MYGRECSPMSDFPCTNCRNTHGRNSIFYVNWYDVDDRIIKKRLRLCQKCVFEELAPLLAHADVKTERGEWQFADYDVETYKWHNANSVRMDSATRATIQSNAPRNTSISFDQIKALRTNSSAKDAPAPRSQPPTSSSEESKPTQKKRGTSSRSKNSLNKTES